MMKKKNTKPVQDAQKKKLNTKISSLNIDKNEYQEIVLSNSNIPDRDFFKNNYYD